MLHCFFRRGLQKKNRAPRHQPPPPKGKNFFCPNRGLSGLVATLQGSVCFPDGACGFGFSRALRGWGQNRFHRSFPPFWGLSWLNLLFGRGLQKKIFPLGGGCRGCRQGWSGWSGHPPRPPHPPTKATPSSHPTQGKQPPHPRQADTPPKASRHPTQATPHPIRSQGHPPRHQGRDRPGTPANPEYQATPSAADKARFFY